MSAPHWLALASSMHPDRPALVDAGVEVSYERLGQLAVAAAGALSERGVAPGDRVALALPAGADYVAAVHGCWIGGAAAVPIDLRLGAGERRIRAAGAVTVVEEPLSGPAGAGAATGFEHDAVAAVLHTSGTTAAPRPVELTFGNFLASALGSAVALGLDPAERWLCPMPLTHVGGLSIPIRSAIYATTTVLHERFDTAAALAELMDPGRRITIVSLVPTMLARLLDAGLHSPPSLRWALLGGGPIAPALLERAARAGVPVAPTYGMTEACSQIATFGLPLPGAELRLGGDDEVLVRGPMVAPAAVDGDGWLHTGDLGSFDPRGRLTITGRKADTIISGGENVAPAEVEAVLLEHEAIADAGVFGRADPEWGESVVAAVVMRDGAGLDAEQLRAHCAARLARFKVPKAFEAVDRLPRTESGKLLRRELS